MKKQNISTGIFIIFKTISELVKFITAQLCFNEKYVTYKTFINLRM